MAAEETVAVDDIGSNSNGSNSGSENASQNNLLPAVAVAKSASLEPQDTFVPIQLLEGSSESSLSSSSSSTKPTTTTTAAIPIGAPRSAGQLLKRVAWLAFGFSLVFTGYHVAQSFVTSILHSYGFAALCIIYINFAVGSLIAPIINSAVMQPIFGPGASEKATMTLAGTAYVIFVVCLASGSKTAVLMASVLKGLASGLLWISQGVWLTKSVSGFTRYIRQVGGSANADSADGIIGMATGIFFTIYNSNGIIGNALTISLLEAGVAVSTVLLVMAAISLLGTFIISMAAPSPISPDPPVVAAAAAASVGGPSIDGDNHASLQSLSSVNTKMSVTGKMLYHSIADRLRATTKLAGQRKMRLLLPYFLCQGVNMAYTYGNYPTFLQFASATATDTAPQSGAASSVDSRAAINISTGFLLYGIGSMIGSYLWGKLYDWCHGRLYPLLACHFILVVLNQSLLVGGTLLASHSASTLLAILITVGFIFGLTDFLTNAIINNSIAKNYESNPADLPSAFSLYRICFCLGFAVAAGASTMLPGVLDSNVGEDNSSAGSDDGYERYGWMIMIAFNQVMMLISVAAGGSLEALNDSSGSSSNNSSSNSSSPNFSNAAAYRQCGPRGSQGDSSAAARKRKSAVLMLH